MSKNELTIILDDGKSWIYFDTEYENTTEALQDFQNKCDSCGINIDNIHISGANINTKAHYYHEEFADLYTIEYKWPEDASWRYGFAIHTNMEDEDACKACGIDDSHVLIFSESFDKDFIKKNFDGLEIHIIDHCE